MFCRDAGDGDVDGEDGADDPQLAIASEILPPILELLPNLKSSDPKESAAAAAEMVALTNNTSTEEDTLVGRSGALEVLGQVLSKGNEEGRVSAASALANLIANSDANKKSIIAMPEVIPAILNVSLVSEKGAAVSARALLNLVSNKEAVLLLCRLDGAIGRDSEKFVLAESVYKIMQGTELSEKKNARKTWETSLDWPARDQGGCY